MTMMMTKYPSETLVNLKFAMVLIAEHDSYKIENFTAGAN